MSEEAIKQRLYRAINSAISILDTPRGRYKITRLDGNPFHIEASRKKEVLKIRIVIDEIKQDDVSLVFDCDKIPDAITREIWCKRSDKKDFEVREER